MNTEYIIPEFKHQIRILWKEPSAASIYGNYMMRLNCISMQNMVTEIRMKANWIDSNWKQFDLYALYVLAVCSYACVVISKPPRHWPANRIDVWCESKSITIAVSMRAFNANGILQQKSIVKFDGLKTSDQWNCAYLIMGCISDYGSEWFIALMLRVYSTFLMKTTMLMQIMHFQIQS